MRKSIIIFILLVVVLGVSFVTYRVIKNSQTNIGSLETSNEQNLQEEIAYTIYGEADYKSTNPEDLYKDADLVIIGKYVEKNKSYVTDYSAIVTESKFEVSKVLKGEYLAPEINITYYGGVVPIKEYIATQSEGDLEKLGIEKSEISLYSNKLVESTAGTVGVNVEGEKEYVIFLSYDENENLYFVLADGYGVRELSSDNKIYNLDTNTFDKNIEELK